jgi:hypothetical protein
VVDWLRAIDWSAKPGDTSVMDMPPLSALSLTKRDGAKLDLCSFQTARG